MALCILCRPLRASTSAPSGFFSGQPPLQGPGFPHGKPDPEVTAPIGERPDMFTPRRTGLFALFAGLMLAFSMVSVDYAEARRGGSFGSRGLRTHQSAPATRTAPNQAA